MIDFGTLIEVIVYLLVSSFLGLDITSTGFRRLPYCVSTLDICPSVALDSVSVI